MDINWLVRENGVNVKIDLKKLEDSVFLVIILQITTFDLFIILV